MALQEDLLIVVLVLVLVEVVVPGVTPITDLVQMATDALTPDWSDLLSW